MSDNVIRLPRPRAQRPAPEGLGFYVRASRNDHVALLDLLATGEDGVFGLVIDAQHVDRHRDLITEARRRDLDVILDPKILQMGFPGAMTEGLAALPWGLERHHNVTDFDGSEGQQRAAQIVEAAVSNGVTQLLGPTHLLSSANDPWLRRDITMMTRTADEIARSGKAKELDLSVPARAQRVKSATGNQARGWNAGGLQLELNIRSRITSGTRPAITRPTLSWPTARPSNHIE